MFWLLSFAGGVLVAALMTFLLGNVFGRGEDLPDVKQGEAAQQHWRNLTEAPVTAASVPEVQFSLSLRGYRQDEVDAYLENVRARLEELERAAGIETTLHQASANVAAPVAKEVHRPHVENGDDRTVVDAASVDAPLKEEN